MVRRLPPWWVCLLGLIFIVGNGLKLYGAIVGPVPAGWVFDGLSDDVPTYRIAALSPDSPARAAGFSIDDRVDAADLRSYVADAREGRLFDFRVERGGQRLVRSITPMAESIPRRIARMGAGPTTLVVAGLLCVALAGVIVLTRPRDVVAGWGALALAQLGTNAAAGATGALRLTPEIVANVFRPLPAPLVAFVPLAQTIAFFVPITTLVFLGNFPREARWRPRTWVLVWLPALITLPFVVPAFWLPAYRPLIPMFMPAAARLPVMMAGAGYCAAGIATLVWHYAHLSDPNERRRVRVMSAGFVAAVLALVVMISTNVVRAAPDQHPTVRLVSSSLLFLASPVLIAYAILRHRMFDIHVMLRLGLQYAVARGVVLALVPLLGMALVADVLWHRTDSLANVLARRGWIYGVGALLALLFHTRQKVWLDAVDRRFFRERYDAQGIVRAVVEDIRRAGSIEAAALPLVRALEQALHPARAAVMVQRPGARMFRAIAAEPEPPPDLSGDSRVIGLLRLLGKPLELPHSEWGWLRRQLPEEEVVMLRRAGIEWVFPVAVTEPGVSALIALGPKRSEQPYSRDDQRLVETLSVALGLLVDRQPPTRAPEAGFEECSTCGQCYEAATERCPDDRTQLSRSSSSRVVAARYVLERRRGQGGMGTVYEATDRRLQRRVALKVIRPDLLDADDATTRFEREARAAAAFSHPNVVTVHDFGVEPSGRAYLVMELLDGPTLRSEIDRAGPLPATRALGILRGVCTAVAAAHERQLLHRDIKPENIVIVHGPDGEQAKICDFGLVKPMAVGPAADRTTALTSPRVLVGTMRYVAPEQWRGESPARSWDVWALGVVAYEMLAGQYPFARGTEWHTAVLAGRATPLSTHVPDAPTALDRFFARALSADPSVRPQSAMVFLHELEEAFLTRESAPAR